MVTNFNNEELIVPKATVLGVAEEMPGVENLKPELPNEGENLDQHCRLENLKARLRLAYETVKRANKRSYLKNKRLHDRKAKLSSFNIGDIIYLYNPSRTPGKCNKFHKFWTGHFKVTANLSELNYEIISTNNKKQGVHVNRMKPAYNAEIWKPKHSTGISSKQATRLNKRARRKTTRTESEEDEVRIGPLLRARPPVDQVDHRTPQSSSGYPSSRRDFTRITPFRRQRP
jgi:hypothetical protein